jgi:hypothetical protein
MRITDCALTCFFPQRTQSKCSKPNHTLIQPQILVKVAAPIVCFVVKTDSQA